MMQKIQILMLVVTTQPIDLIIISEYIFLMMHVLIVIHVSLL
jgi:hypothetical protein